MGLKYKIEGRPPRQQIPWHFLIVWVDDFGDVLFCLGDRHEWFKNREKGYQFDGTKATVCAYPNVDTEMPLSRQDALIAAIAYQSGQYRTMTVNLSDRGY